MKKKLVIYNGGTEKFGHCTSPHNLVIGQVYEVMQELVFPYHTNYVLKDITGMFNSDWFDKLRKSYVAVSTEVPVVGRRLKANRIEFANGSAISQTLCYTSTVQEVQTLGVNTYKVLTRNNIYIIIVA